MLRSGRASRGTRLPRLLWATRITPFGTAIHLGDMPSPLQPRQDIEIIEREGLCERAAEMGERMMKGLQSLKHHPIVGDVRGIGLMGAVELVRDRETRPSLRLPKPTRSTGG